MTLPKQHRLKGSRAFKALFSTARPAMSEHFSLRASHGDAMHTYRLSVLVPVKIAARATDRNALRRKVSAQIERIAREHTIAGGVRAALTLRTGAIPGPEELRHELMALMKKSGILNQ